MVEVNPSEVLDEAEFVKTTEIHSELSVIQVWYGGTQVRVIEVDLHNEWREVDVWNVSDDKGRPVSQEKIGELMDQHFAVIQESFDAMEDEEQ